MATKKYIVTYWNGDLDMVLGIYNSNHEAMGGVLYHALTTYGYGEGDTEFGVKSTGDSGYNSYFDILISKKKKSEGGYNFDQRDPRNCIDRYRVFFWESNFEEA